MPNDLDGARAGLESAGRFGRRVRGRHPDGAWCGAGAVRRVRIDAVTSAPRAPGTTQEHAVAWLRHAIVTGALRPGERVGQEDVAASIGVSLAPVREALRVLGQEGQLTYLPRRGYFVTELRLEDVREIYALRGLLEERATRLALPGLGDDDLHEIRAAAEACVVAAEAGDIAAELEANRRFHFAIMRSDAQPHTLRLLATLWDSTEAYRAMYYNDPDERRRAAEAHDEIIAAVEARDADVLIDALDRHRERALTVLAGILSRDGTDA